MWVSKEAPFRKTSVKKHAHTPTFSCTSFSYWATISMNSAQTDLLLQGDHSAEGDTIAEKLLRSSWNAGEVLTRPDDTQSSNVSWKVTWIADHIQGE